MILVNKYIETGFSGEDAKKLGEIIQPIYERGEKVLLDFTGVKMFTTLFFNTALAKYIVVIGPEKYDQQFIVENLSEVGQVTYKHSLDNAKEYYAKSVEQRASHDEILEDVE